MAPFFTLNSISIPLDAPVFDTLMRRLGVGPEMSLALAVSGGPDSMALAFCVRRWTCASDRVMAFIVDHRLRPESADEAEQTKQRLKAMGIRAEILVWEHPPLTSKRQSAARHARYDLLRGACVRHGFPHLLLAHQMEDQAETILFRLAKGSGVDGLAGISPVVVRDGLCLVRPFLGVSKAQLIATCEANAIPFVTDPSNASESYARGRLRRVMPLLAAEGLSLERLIDLGDRAREAQEALVATTHDFLRRAMTRSGAGVLYLDRAALRAAPRAIALRALGTCLHALSAHDYPAERGPLVAVLEALVHDSPMKPRTLYGCLLTGRAEVITLAREPSAITDRKPLAPGKSVLWDGRWRVELAKDGPLNLEVRALGVQPHEVLDSLSPKLRKHVPQGRVRATLPALWEGETLRAIPALSPDDNSKAMAILVATSFSE